MGRVQIYLLLLLLGITLKLPAQTMELGLSGGAAGYLGDLNQDQPFKPSGLSAGAYVKANFDPYWTLGLHYNYGKIKGDDLKSKHQQFRDRGLNFSTALNEVSLQLDFNFFEYFAGGGRRNFSPYLYTGAGIVFFNPKGRYPGHPVLGDESYNLRFYRTEGQREAYRNFALSVPYGLGIKARLKENWGFFSQIGFRTTYTDYLDDVSSNYPSGANWPNDENRPLRESLSNPSTVTGYGISGSQRGDFRKRDTYMFVGIGISYTFVSQKCYTF